MSKEISKAVFQSLLPSGSIWSIKEDSDLDLLFDAMGDNSDLMVEFLGKLADVRNPYRTDMLGDMEREYGLRPGNTSTDYERRAGLAAAITNTNSDGSLDTLQAKLTEAGFDATVYENRPAINPTIILEQAFETVFGSSGSVFGASATMFNFGYNGSLLVNGDIFGDDSFFSIPEDPNYWPLVFFVGGTVVRDEETDEIQVLAAARIPGARRDEIKRLILKYKPMHSWCGLVVYFT